VQFAQFDFGRVLTRRILFTSFGTPCDTGVGELETNGFGFAAGAVGYNEDSGVAELGHGGGDYGFIIGGVRSLTGMGVGM